MMRALLARHAAGVHRRGRLVVTALAIVFAFVRPHAQQPPTTSDDTFRFKSGVELVNVTALVSDGSGRFVTGLQKDDFVVYEDDQPQAVTHFSAERVPVSLGIALDTSGSMLGDRIAAAQSALERFLSDMLAPDDEIFLYRFSDRPRLVQNWTTDRDLLTRALGRLAVHGSTAMYDAVAEAVPLIAAGHNPRKALVVLSDGNDTSSQTSLRRVKQLIRESEALVYAIGIECGRGGVRSSSFPQFQRRGPMPIPVPWPFPPGRRGGRPLPPPPPPTFPSPPQNRSWTQACDERVDRGALREMTDDSGGRTEIVDEAQELEQATATIADELSKQYYLGYPSPVKKDGRWHSIRVEVRNQHFRIRARRGYVAS
jgi:Ca-activated chloride channel family protein